MRLLLCDWLDCMLCVPTRIAGSKQAAMQCCSVALADDIDYEGQQPGVG